MASIKPCPFCGSFQVKVVSFGDQSDSETTVQCTICKATGPAVPFASNNQVGQAFNNWNKRAPEPESQDVLWNKI